jgi:hypothetical protein
MDEVLDVLKDPTDSNFKAEVTNLKYYTQKMHLMNLIPLNLCIPNPYSIL